MATTSQALTREQKVAVIERGMARLPVMAVEVQWAFGVQFPADLVAPPIWVRRVILLTFNINPDAHVSNESADPVKVSKVLGSLFGFAEGAAIVFRPDKTVPNAQDKAELNEEHFKKGVSDAAMPHLAKWDEQAAAVRHYIRQGTTEQYSAFMAGQSEAAKFISDEENEPGSTTNMTHELLTFLWTFWPEIPLTGSVHNLHQWITELGYLHCSEKLVEKVCRRAELRLSELGAEKRPPTN